MNNRPSYKVRSPEVWTVIRDAYLAGDSAVVLAKRFDVTIANIQRKAGREGWTKRAYAAARAAEGAGPPPEEGTTPRSATTADNQAFGLAMIEAEAALRAGRGADAMRLMQAAEHYLELRHRLADQARERAEAEAATDSRPEELWKAILDRAVKIAEAMLTNGSGPALLARKVYAWRASNLGPEVAAADFRRGAEGNWGGRYWNPDGSLKDADLEEWTDWELKEIREIARRVSGA
jgi:hypothetical protein